MMNRKYKIWQPFILAVVMIAGVFIGLNLYDQVPTNIGIQKREKSGLDEIQDILDIINAKYGIEQAESELKNQLINSIAESLDPHSAFLVGDKYGSFLDQVKGAYRGIGIEYTLMHDTVYIIMVVPEGPAEKAGIRCGDQIYKVGETVVSGKGLKEEEVAQAWRENTDSICLEGRSVKGQMINRCITKGQVTYPSIWASLLLNDSIGYIKLARFSENTYFSYMNHLEQLHQQGLKHLILDVRDNPGGSFENAIRIAGQFIDKPDQILAYIDGPKLDRTEYKSNGKVFFPVERLAVLVNERTVSAAEVLAGCIQDHDRGTIIGRRTYGKALVQEVFPISDSSALNLTVGMYYLPTGRYIQKNIMDKTAYKDEIEQRCKSGELFTGTSKFWPDSSQFVTKKGKYLPEGVGVVPDVFVAADSLMVTTDWNDVWHTIASASFYWYANFGDKLPKKPAHALRYLEDRDIDEDLQDFNGYTDQVELLLSQDIYLKEFLHSIIVYQFGWPAYFELAAQSSEEVKIALKNIMSISKEHELSSL